LPPLSILPFPSFRPTVCAVVQVPVEAQRNESASSAQRFLHFLACAPPRFEL
jgi:hypothetical protein